NAARHSGSKRVVIDGLRQLATLRALREGSACPVAVLFIYASPDVAFALYRQRDRQGDANFVESEIFMKFLSAPVERGVPYIMQEADAVIYNWVGGAQYGNVLAALAAELGFTRSS
ncbi:MAG: hypothetical protein WD005_04055, partial [Haliea sp.]